MTTYRIDRSKWVCGGIAELGPSALLNAKGRMCCLGQVCKAEGIPDTDLLGTAMPRGLANLRTESLPGWMLAGEINAHVKNMASSNDFPGYTQEEREKRLKELALKVDVELIFFGELQ